MQATNVKRTNSNSNNVAYTTKQLEDGLVGVYDATETLLKVCDNIILARAAVREYAKAAQASNVRTMAKAGVYGNGDEVNDEQTDETENKPNNDVAIKTEVKAIVATNAQTVNGAINWPDSSLYAKNADYNKHAIVAAKQQGGDVNSVIAVLQSVRGMNKAQAKAYATEWWDGDRAEAFLAKKAAKA